MDPFSFLETTAEISITFGGLVSIFLVLARRDGSFAPSVALSIRMVLVISVGCLFFAAVPLIASAFGASGPDLWRASSALILLVSVFMSFYVAKSRRELPLEERKAAPLWRFSRDTLNSVSLLATVANTVGWPLAPNAGVYLFSIWSLLGIACAHFLGLVFNRVLSEIAE